MKKLTDDEIMAKALKCPESEKVPLEVGDRVIALEDFTFWEGITDIKKGEKGDVTEVSPHMKSENGPFRVCVKWDSHFADFYGRHKSIGKLVKREGK